MPIRVLIVDDERLARSQVRRSLNADFEVVGECANGLEALTVLRRTEVDLMFLDVQMPGLDGLGLLDAVGQTKLPSIIFVTAYDQYAVRAFEVYAIDYILKPFDDLRMEQALIRARERLAKPEPLEPHLRALLEDLKARPEFPARLAVRTRERMLLVAVKDILWVQADENYVILHCVGKASHLLRSTLRQMEAMLDPKIFLKAHRSALVNLDAVVEVRSLFHGEHALILRTGAEIKIGRSQWSQIQAKLGPIF
jgi:two-component system LytT family response regulator